jgi:hypothetical protein
VFSGAFLIMEGTSDALLFENLVTRGCCRVLAAGNKDRVLTVLEILRGSDFAGVVGIVDADFDAITGLPTEQPNLIQVGVHDLDVMILESEALSKVLRAHGSQEKISAAIQAWQSEIRDQLFNLALPLAALRLYSQRNLLNLTFEEIDFERFIPRQSLTINVDDMIKTVLNKSQRFDLTPAKVRNGVDAILAEGHPRSMMCVGHDVVEILAIGLRRVLGSKSPSEVSRERLELDLRLAYETPFFRNSELFSRLLRWEEENLEFSFGLR